MMYDGWRKDGAHSNEWMGVTKAFLEHAFKDATGRLVKCPCNRCENKWPQKNNARIAAVNYYYKKIKGQKMSKSLGANEIYLTEEQYLESVVDWLAKDMEA